MLGDPGFSSLLDQPVPYMERTRRYYAALGFPGAYRWASFAEVPFSPLRRGLAESCVGLVTTAAPFVPGRGEQGAGAAYNAAAKFYRVYSVGSDAAPDLRISHVAYDRDHTSAADARSYNPLAALLAAAGAGRIGRVGARVHGAPTNRSQRATMEVDAPEVLRRCLEDGVEVAVLVPNCPVCHQSLSLVARQLEAGGIATVILGCAKDIVEQCGVPRFCFSDFPLGNGAGKPFDEASQAATLELAFRVLEGAPGARTTVQSPQRWAADPAWKLDYSNAERLSEAVLAERRAEFVREKEVARLVRAAEEE